MKPGDKDSPATKRREELRAELNDIRHQQSGFKASRGNQQEKISALDAQLKSRQAEQKASRGRVSFKNVEEVDAEIKRLEKQVDTGTMKLVDEKKALAEISSLRKQRKVFAQFDESQKGIDDVKAQISNIRKGMENPEAKALGERYNAIQKELDHIKAEQDDVYKNINSLRDERTKLSDVQKEKWEALKAIRDEYHTARIAAKNYEYEQKRVRAEKMRAENEAYQREKRQKVAQEKLEQASEPAYMNEIMTAEGLVRYFDPSTPVESKVLRGPSGFAAEAQRSIDASEIKGTKVSKKEDREEMYFMGSGGKKGKKGKKGTSTQPSTPSTPAEGKFNLSIGVIEELGKINVEPPMNQNDVPGVLEKLKAKVTQWKADQEKKTKEVCCLPLGRTFLLTSNRTSSKHKPRSTNSRPNPLRHPSLLPLGPTILQRSWPAPMLGSMAPSLPKPNWPRRKTLTLMSLRN